MGRGVAGRWASAGGVGGVGRGASAIWGSGGGGGGGGGGGAGASANGLGGAGGAGLGGVCCAVGCGGRGGSGTGGGAGAGTCGGAGGIGGAAAIGGGGAGGVGGTSTGAPCSVAELKTMSKPCSSTSKAPCRGARGSSSRKTKPANNRCAKTEARIARPPRPGRRGLSQLIGRRPLASAAPGRVNSGSVRRIGGSNGS